MKFTTILTKKYPLHRLMLTNRKSSSTKMAIVNVFTNKTLTRGFNLTTDKATLGTRANRVMTKTIPPTNGVTTVVYVVMYFMVTFAGGEDRTGWKRGDCREDEYGEVVLSKAVSTSDKDSWG